LVRTKINPRGIPTTSVDRTGPACISSAWVLMTFIVVILLIANSVLLSNGASFIAFGQTSTSRSQTWIDKENNVKISFSYRPSVPIVDKSTELKFNVADLRNGSSIDSMLARVVITNGQRTFKFPQVTVHNGTFSVNYLFPDIGNYQSIVRIDSANFSTLASFQVFVPFQASVNLASNYGWWIIISIIAISAFVVFFIRIVKRRNRA
jgi:hypothetical protein